MNPTTSRLATLMGTASVLSMINALSANAQVQMAQATPEAVPEQVLITGSLIHGTAAVGVPVTNLGAQDITTTGAVTIGDLFRTVPVANVAPGPSSVNSGGHQERETRVNIRGLDATGPRSLLLIDGVRFPPQADGICAIDPSIIPALALDRVDILADGASATYGSDAIAGVINVVLKRNFDGAVTLLHVQSPTDGGGAEFQASQLFGRTWEGGDVTITYEWSDEEAVKGNKHSKFTTNFLPWGLEDPFINIGSAVPGIATVGAPTVVSALGAGVTGTKAKVPLLVDGICTNCWSIPHGTGANFNAGLNSGLGPTAPMSAGPTWASLTAAANAGDNNFIDPLSGTGAYEQAAVQRNSLVATFDQRLIPNVSFFFTGFYTNRRIEQRAPTFGGQGLSNYLSTFAIPTTNPYYPTGAPAGVRVSYNLAIEDPPSVPAWEISARYSFGLNLDLPFSWSGQIYESRSYEDVGLVRHFISTGGVSAALGWTVPVTDPRLPVGSNNVNIAKPATVPYLNLFCDPFAFQCNSPATLQYIGATSTLFVHYNIEEKGVRFDGPVVDLPGGQIKTAIGGTYESDNVVGFNGNNQSVPGNAPATQFETIAPEPYHVLAGFGQVDVPIFGDNFNFPLVRKLDLEGSVRYDQYRGNPKLLGDTTNPKVAFTWLVDETAGLTVRGSWGSSFRFANAGEFSTVLSGTDQSVNIAGAGTNITFPCATPTAGSLAQAICAAGIGTTPGGISFGGGPQAAMRSYVDASTGQTIIREGGVLLSPEKALNYSVGIEIAPQIAFLKGFDLQSTFYSVKVNGVLTGNLGAASPSGVANPAQRYHFIVPSDLGCPVAANSNPTSCLPFETMVKAALNWPTTDAQGGISQLTNIFWLNDSGTTNTGYTHVDGIDWNASYDFDAGDFGAWNTGITGTYYLHRWTQTVSGDPTTLVDGFSQTLQGLGGAPNQSGVETLPRFNYRARLGWSNGPFNATVFWNHQSHYFEILEAVPSNVNFQCTTPGGTLGGGSMPCAIGNFTNIQPAVDSFDLSFGYNTGMLPANIYLQNITIQLTVQNIMGIHASMEYGPTSSTRNPAGFSIRYPDVGRVVGLTLLKNW